MGPSPIRAAPANPCSEDIPPHNDIPNSRHASKTNKENEMLYYKQLGARLSSSSQNTGSTIQKEHKPNNPALHPPPLSFSPWDKKTSIIVCTLGLLFFDLVLPCVIYYALAYLTSLDIEVNLGISCASLGLGEMMELPLRGYRLIKHRARYAPLGQEAKWGFDFLFWWYLIATVIGIVPYIISTSLDGPVLWLFLMTPGFLSGFAVLTAAISAFPFRLPCRVSSNAKGERCKPFVYYVIEDFVAVDAGQMRGYREELRERWNASPVFRRLIWDVNLWWIAGGVVFTGSLAGITWGCSFNVAYGLSFGVLFVWIGIWALGTWWWVGGELRRECEWFARRAGSIDGEVEKESDIV
jgi:hypothetical protein